MTYSLGWSLLGYRWTEVKVSRIVTDCYRHNDGDETPPSRQGDLLILSTAHPLYQV